MPEQHDAKLPYDIWIDIETGDWGLRSNLRYVRQTNLPLNLADASESDLRCVGMDWGVPEQYL